MILDVLPCRSDSAAGNMATDFLLLQRYPAEDRPRFRHYGWHRPAATFGFGQKIAFVREQLKSMAGILSSPADGEGLELCRRPTGGGLVDQRDDWTYAVVIPRGHAVCDCRALEAYRIMHVALANALRQTGCAAELETRCPTEEGRCARGEVCFQRAELFDVVDAATRAKIAGAAQKRNKRGLLVQGSIWRPAVGAIDWDDFHDRFARELGRALEVEPEATGWPGFSDEEMEALTEQYASPEWLERR